MVKKQFQNIYIILKVYALAIFIFTVFRLLLFANELERIDHLTSNYDVFYSFIMGLRFDIVICSYILLLPYLLLSINLFLFKNKFFDKISFYFTLVLFSIAFLISTADIPYFNQFFSRFSITAFAWSDNPKFVLKMIVGEPRLWLYIIPFSVSVFLFYKVLLRIFSVQNETYVSLKKGLEIIVTVLFLGVMILGVRGRVEKKTPIRVGMAYFSNNPFLNQLGLNPNFTLMQSFLEALKEENKPIKLLPENIAISNVQKYLAIHNVNPKSPILRTENLGSSPNHKNIVIILMESMTAANMERHGNKDKITPFLDSISNKGYYFENNYSAGIHTYNGIFSTLFSFPGIFRQHPMKESKVLKNDGIASELKRLGYTTTYFTIHDGQFDNVEGFLKANDFGVAIPDRFADVDTKGFFMRSISL